MQIGSLHVGKFFYIIVALWSGFRFWEPTYERFRSMHSQSAVSSLALSEEMNKLQFELYQLKAEALCMMNCKLLIMEYALNRLKMRIALTNSVLKTALGEQNFTTIEEWRNNIDMIDNFLLHGLHSQNLKSCFFSNPCHKVCNRFLPKIQFNSFQIDHHNFLFKEPLLKSGSFVDNVGMERESPNSQTPKSYEVAAPLPQPEAWEYVFSQF